MFKTEPHLDDNVKNGNSKATCTSVVYMGKEKATNYLSSKISQTEGTTLWMKIPWKKMLGDSTANQNQSNKTNQQPPSPKTK